MLEEDLLEGSVSFRQGAHQLTPQLVAVAPASARPATDDDPLVHFVGDEHAPDKLPRIVLRDPVGRELDTDTVYQRAINEARRKRKHGEFPMDPVEWRLPHGKLPARPDYTRKAPKLQRPELKRLQKRKEWLEATRSLEYLLEVLEREVGDLATSVSLQALQELSPAVAAVMEEPTDTGRYGDQPWRSYMQFCGPASITERPLEQTEKREKEYIHPGFCYGCRRAGLCYGCAQDSSPHVHYDKPARTGGGFTYWKRDLPTGASDKSNPINWKVSHPTMYVFYEGQKFPDLKKYGLTMKVGKMGVSERQDAVDALRDRLRHYYRNVPEKTPDFVPGYPAYPVSSRGTREVSELTSSFPMTNVDFLPPTPPTEPPSYHEDEDQSMEDFEEATDAQEHIEEPARSPTPEPEPEPDTERDSGVGSEKPSERSKESTQKRKSLYKAPSSFKLKRGPKKFTTSTTPFSTDRQYDIPQGKGIEIKKSDKELTKFIDGPSRDGSLWKEPTKFELKDREDTDSKFYVPLPVKEPSTSHRERVQAEEPLKYGQVHRSPSVVSKDSNLPDEASRSPTPHLSPPLRPRDIPDASTLEQEVQAPGTASPVTEVVEKQPPTPLPPIPPGLTRKESPLDKGQSLPTEPTAIEDSGISRETTETDQETDVTRRRKVPPVKKTKKEEPKRVRKEEPRRVVFEAPPPLPMLEREPTPELPRTPTPPPPPKRIDPPPLPALAPPAPPPLPEYAEPERPKREVSSTTLEAPPPMPEPPPQRRPAPKVRPRRKLEERQRMIRRQPTEKIPKVEMKHVQDPLDYLSKWCIIHKDRLPHYERVFRSFLSDQQFRYADVPLPSVIVAPPDGTPVNPQMQKLAAEALSKEAQKRQKEAEQGTEGQKEQGAPAGRGKVEEKLRNKITEAERRMIKDLSLVNREVGLGRTPGLSGADELVQRLTFALENTIEKYDQLQEKLDELQVEKINLIATNARRVYPEVAQPNFIPKTTKKSKKRKAAKENNPVEELTSVQPGRVTNADIVMRLSGGQLEALNDDPAIWQLDLEIGRLEERLKYVDDKIEEMEDEKRKLQLYARDEFLQAEVRDNKSEEFRRAQSPLYQRIQPQPDPELNLSELEEALQQVNGHLLTDKEMQYIYHVLELPGRQRINMKLFAAVAALSEKVTQLNPVIRKLINKINFEALDVKKERVKELFSLLEEHDHGDVPEGMINVQSLVTELVAGGVTNEHVEMVVGKFNRDNKGVVDFMDFLIYVPLFIEIHTRIIKDPLSSERDL